MSKYLWYGLTPKIYFNLLENNEHLLGISFTKEGKVENLQFVPFT